MSLEKEKIFQKEKSSKLTKTAMPLAEQGEQKEEFPLNHELST